MFGSTALCSTMRIARVAIPALALLAGSAAMGQEITLKNDNYPDPFPTTPVALGMVGYFAPQEEVNVWFTAPCAGTITAVQVLWHTQSATVPPTPSVENAITFYEPGLFPVRSSVPLLNLMPTPNTPAELIGPVMQSNGLHEFRFLDENSTIPLQIPVTANQTFCVSFEFGEDHSNPGIDVPTIPVDLNGATQNKNGIYGIGCGFYCWGQTGCIPGNPPGSCGSLPGTTGDFVIRVKMICTPVSGACCLPSGQCVNSQTQSGCQAQGGMWQGADSLCSQVTCATPTGACCTSTGCQTLTQAQCTAAGGTYRGNNTLCSTAGICNGQCCIPSTQGCSASVNQAQCTALGGTFQGVGTNCSSTVCFPMGACCLENGTCLAGPMTPAQCVAQGGTFKGHQSTCASPCPLPVGKCCVPVGGNYVCLDTIEQAECVNAFGGTWGGPNSSCTSGSEQCPPCFADINADASVNVTDLLTVIGAWGPCSNCPADIAPSPFGDNQVNVSDLLLVIGQWGTCQ